MTGDLLINTIREDLDRWRRYATTNINGDDLEAARYRTIINAIAAAHHKLAGDHWPPPYVIASTGRSGSGYIAKLLTRLGIRCGHEGYFNPGPHHDHTLLIDSSWCAIPGLAHHPAVTGDTPGAIFHQTRHPLDVITSHAATWVRSGIYWPLKRQTFRTPTTDIWTDATHVYLDANRQIEHHARPTLRWKVEDITQQTIRTIARTMGITTIRIPGNPTDLLPNNINQHHDGDRCSWADLELRLRTGPLGSTEGAKRFLELRELADHYGYE